MKKLSPFILFALLIHLCSCVVLSPKKYKTLLSQKDSLAKGLDAANVKIQSLDEELSRLRSDTSSLNTRIAELQTKLEGLDANYASLRLTALLKLINYLMT